MQDKQFELIINDLLEFNWRTNPVNATSDGVHKYDDQLGNYNQDNINRMIKISKSIKQRLNKEIDISKLSGHNQTNYQIWSKGLDSSITEMEQVKPFNKYPSFYPGTFLYGIQLLIIRDFAPIKERIEMIIARMSKAENLLKDGINNLKNPPRIFTEIAIETTEGGLQFFKHIIPSLASKIPSLNKKWLKVNNEVIKQLTQYLEYLKKDLLPRSNGDYAIGRDLFNYKLKTNYFLDYTADNLFEIGKEVFAQTKKEMEIIAKRIAPNKTWQEIMTELKDDHPSADELMDFYTGHMERTRDFVIDKNLISIPHGQKIEITETPLFAQPLIPYAAYMPPAPLEKKQKGFFWVTPIDKKKSAQEQTQQLQGHNKYGAVIAALHEGYPGHHLQLTTAYQHPSRLRRLCGDTVFIEGWAFYCEDMMAQEGFYDDKTRLYQLKYVLLRACRVMIDVGLHTKRMQFKQAVEMLVNQAGVEKVNALIEVKRYTMSPTQPMSYLIGKRQILKIRDAYQKKMGHKFTLKDFHNKLLNAGSIPVKLIKEEVFS